MISAPCQDNTPLVRAPEILDDKEVDRRVSLPESPSSSTERVPIRLTSLHQNHNGERWSPRDRRPSFDGGPFVGPGESTIQRDA